MSLNTHLFMIMNPNDWQYAMKSLQIERLIINNQNLLLFEESQVQEVGLPFSDMETLYKNSCNFSVLLYLPRLNALYFDFWVVEFSFFSSLDLIWDTNGWKNYVCTFWFVHVTVCLVLIDVDLDGVFYIKVVNEFYG